jgi:hypothetical protein
MMPNSKVKRRMADTANSTRALPDSPDMYLNDARRQVSRIENEGEINRRLAVGRSPLMQDSTGSQESPAQADMS